MKKVSSFIIIAPFLLGLANLTAYAQEPNHTPQTILEVRIEGNAQVSTGDINRIIKTRQGRPFNPTTLEEDKRSLMQKRWFIDVKPKVDRTPEGYIVTFTCIERQLIHYIRVNGNHAHTRKTILEEANIKEGDALDPVAVRQAAERIAQFYRETGYHQVYVEITRGDELGDRGVVFRISEGPKQRVLSVEFEGNKIAGSERLRTLIQSKPGLFLWINSDFTRKKLDEDVETLINYYRKLGFFYAKVDRVFVETRGYTGLGQNRGWVKVKFIIDEGPRCKIRDIRFVGNNVFSHEELAKVMKLGRGRNQFYNQDALEVDMQAIKEKYGDHGYVFAMPSPDPRVERDHVDLVITIREGPRCFLETLDVEIKGNDGAESYTKWHPVLNRVSLRPGDILRTSEINASRRRLMASALFNTNPMQGATPEFIFDFPKEALELEAAAERAREQEREADQIASGEPLIRGQAPQPYFGSVAPAANPLQPATTASVVGMVPVQLHTGQPAETPVILRANPFDTINAPSNIRVDPDAPAGVSPYVYGVRGRWIVQETRTGSLMASLAVSSDAGLMGRFIYEEQNFDILNYPRGLRLTDWRNAFRGKGQRFRIEAVPGTQVQRYSASWETPYLFDLDYSFGVNGFYYQRYYTEWNEDRTGGTLSFGKLWTPDISTRLALGGQEVKIYRPAIPVDDLMDTLGRHPLYNIGLTAIYNTRDSEYMPTEGHMVSAGIEQILGDYQFIRGNVDLRKYFMLRERPDRSGRWVLGVRSSLAVSETGTPIFERYFGGGFTNLRGFEFRGVSPRTDEGYVVGGNVEFYNSVEMIFPLTADDMIRGSIFVDSGTVESSMSRWEDNYRVAMGFGLRLTIPMMGPAPIALDFAFPLSSNRWDDKQVFSFGMSFLR